GAEGEVGDEDTVHDVDVEPLGAAPLERPDGGGELAEVGGEQAGSEVDGVPARGPARHAPMITDRAGHSRGILGRNSLPLRAQPFVPGRTSSALPGGGS